METTTNLLGRGVIVLIVLGVLTAIEFAIAIMLAGSVPLLGIMAAAKAIVIIIYYMHIGQVFAPGKGGH